MRRSIALALVLLVATTASAQDADPPRAGEKPAPERLREDEASGERADEKERNAALLSEALRRLRRTQDLVVRGTIEHKESEQAVGPFGGMPAQVRRQMAGVFGEGLTPFTGAVEAWAAADGTTVILSEAEVPGFAVHLKGDRAITQRTTEDGEDLPLANITKELAPLLDVMRLTRHLGSADLTAKSDAASGDVTFTGELARELVKPFGDGAFNRIRTLRVDGTLVVSPDGRFKTIAIQVTHNDPVAESRRGGGRVRILVQGGGGQVIPVEEDKDEEKHDVEGGKTTYTLSFAGDRPSERAREFRRRVERMLAKR